MKPANEKEILQEVASIACGPLPKDYVSFDKLVWELFKMGREADRQSRGISAPQSRLDEAEKLLELSEQFIKIQIRLSEDEGFYDCDVEEKKWIIRYDQFTKRKDGE